MGLLNMKTYLDLCKNYSNVASLLTDHSIQLLPILHILFFYPRMYFLSYSLEVLGLHLTMFK